MWIRVRTLLTWGIPEKNPLTTSFLASSKSYGSQRLSQINLVNQSLRELQDSGRDSNFFHLCWNVAFQVPKSLNTNYLLFVLTVFPVGRSEITLSNLHWKVYKHVIPWRSWQINKGLRPPHGETRSLETDEKDPQVDGLHEI
ncbi:unnamed protein product [Leuciscus chuanchicus]